MADEEVDHMIDQVLGQGHLAPPQPVPSDYLEMVYLTILFVLGAPLNLAAYSQLSESSQLSAAFPSLHLLKRSLNLADLAIVLIYAPSKVCWLLTYKWRGGLLLCKGLKFAHNMAFQLSSNIITCIALDRLLSILDRKHSSQRRSLGRVRAMLAVAWALAAGESVPQLFFWSLVAPFEAAPSWEQCVSVWEVAQLAQQMRALSPNASLPLSQPPMDSRVYGLLHLLAIFWVPFSLVALSYLVLVVWLLRNARVSRAVDDDLTTSTHSPSAAPATRPTRHASVPSATPMIEIRIHQSGTQPPPRKITVDIENSLSTYGSRGSKAEKKKAKTRDREEETSLCSSTNSKKWDGGGESGQTGTDWDSPQPRSMVVEVNRSRARAVQTSVLLVTFYVVCWLPYNVLNLWRVLDGDRYEGYEGYVNFLHGFIVLNSVINPFLYGMFGPMRPRHSL